MKRWAIALIVGVIFLILAGALVVVLRGPRLDKTSPVSVDTQAPAVMPVPSGRLSLWAFGGEIPGAVWERIAAEFEKSSGYHVQVTLYESEARYRESLRVALSEKKLPDIFLIDSTEAEALWQTGEIAPIDVTPADATTFVPGVLAAFRRGDKTLGFPSEFSLLALYYNKESFDRVGIAYPDTHWTWETLLGIAQAVYLPPGKDRSEPLYSIELPVRFDVWQSFSAQAGGSLYDGSLWQVGTPKTAAAQVKALQYLRDFMRRYVMAPRPPAPPAGKLLLEGKSSMAIAGTELLRDLRRQNTVRWGVAPLPKDETRATVLKTRGWVVSSRCANPMDGARLARALATQPSRSDWLSAQAAAPAGGRPESEQVFYDAASYAMPLPFVSTAPELERIINEELQRWIMQENPSPRVMLEWTQKLLK